MEKIKVAVIGCGFFGAMHAQIYAALPNVELVAVSDISSDRADKIAGDLNTKGYVDYNKILEKEEVDAVDICVPDNGHTEVILKALKANKHILVEKPLANTVEDCRLIYEASASYGKKLMVAHICRFDMRYLKAYETIRKGELGEIIYVTSRRNSPAIGARRYARNSELINHSGVHDIDLVRWFVGSEYKTVYAKGAKKKMIKEGLDVYDAIVAIFTFENGIMYSFENCWSLSDNFPSYIDAKIEIVGTKGSLDIDFFDHGLKIYTDNAIYHPDLYYWPDYMGERCGALKEELAHFVDCIIYDREPRISIKDGYEVAVTAVNALKSLQNDQMIKIR
jgi:UDP-N-acetylglucosamine 3-dehydrogenase